MDKVAILYICTGKYDVFWKDFYDSYEQFFLVNSHKEYFVFTDSVDLYQKDNSRIHIISQKSLGWPDNTLMRYHMFRRIENELLAFDYVFFMNANCICVSKVEEQEFLPFENEILVVQHPGFYEKKNTDFTYDRNPKSTAYIAMGQGDYYVCGGVNGGKTDAFLRMSKSIADCVDADKQKKITALWHDESHINKFILINKNYRILTPSFCYPEGWEMPFQPKILIRDKSKWIDVDKVKSTCLDRIKRKIYMIIRK